MSAQRRWAVTVAILLALAAQVRAYPARAGVTARAIDVGAMPSVPATVEIAIVGTATDLQRIRMLFGANRLAGATPSWARVSRFDPLEVVREHRTPEQRLVRCWVDMSSPRRIRLFFAAGSGERFLVRDLGVSTRFDEMDQQVLEEVLERSVTALLDNEQAGLDRAQAQALIESQRARESPAPVVRVAAPISPGAPARTFHVNVAAFYAGQTLALARPGGSTLALTHGPGLSLAGITEGPQRRWGIWAAAQFQFPNGERGDDVGFDFQTTATRAGLDFHQRLGGDLVDNGFRISHLLLRVGAGLDLVHLTPRLGAIDPPAMLTRARWSNSLVFTAALGAGLNVNQRVRVVVSIFADVLPTSVHYDFADRGQVAPVFSSGRVRPGMALELAAFVL